MSRASVAVIMCFGLGLCCGVGRWLHADDSPPTAQKSDGFEPIFNGTDLTGWEGDMDLWSAKDGEIVGNSPGIRENHFLATKASYGDFILRFKFRVVNNPTGDANSGMQFRSQRVPNSTEVAGYQADIGQGYWGGLYDESRRNKTLVDAPKAELEKVLHRDGWNEYEITCDGPHIVLKLNGLITADYTETEPADKIARSGILALQIHAGGPMEIHAKQIEIKKLNGATGK